MELIINSMLDIMVPLLLAATGGLYTELAGTLNIALEGLMIMGAYFSYTAAAYTGSLFLGTMIGIAASLILAFVISKVTQMLKANFFITALAANLLAPGLTGALSFRFYGNKGILTFPDMPKLPLWNYPLLGQHSPFLLIALLLLVLSYILIKGTAFGIRLKACGIDAGALKSYGIGQDRLREISFLISGFFCALAGSSLSLNLGSYVPGITAGKGWIALVIIYLGGRDIIGLLPATLIFAFAEAVSDNLQGFSSLPGDLVLALPNLFALLVLIGVSIYAGHRNHFKEHKQ
ncbi:MAG: ABC transporter permease [Spirochaetia bacterium]|jgi:simple sugar transport system permease protein|nr:ABC transporter permease [Spirochaetia bacterium]